MLHVALRAHAGCAARRPPFRMSMTRKQQSASTGDLMPKGAHGPRAADAQRVRMAHVLHVVLDKGLA